MNQILFKDKMGQDPFDVQKKDLQHKTKKGIDFITAATFIWLLIYGIWNLDSPAFSKSIYTFMAGGILLPLAFAFSKLFKTQWKIKENPLQPLGLWLNFAQLIYFPFLFFLLYRNPDYFIMGYAIITGAHLFPYAWLYDEIGYAVASPIIALGALIIAFQWNYEGITIIPLFTAVILLMLAVYLFYKNQRLVKYQ
ncbi:DUF7010 family protein [Allomuricauda sp. NBRC 101325]|uniref:DUF7010 family protein n=1 Tax=Allomuricauda sp. NBRC 101325 TaxID=1113758 RepID=UPI0024A546E9|nr:hypothetical protein [Muricauda sp. NBRC 101325]GLU45250.1 hypothetical protein Musp01_28740 [Muricauda sp. NBRC 101325]